MTMVPKATDRPEAPLFADGLGERVVAADGATGELLQILRLRPALTAVPSFEFALRERAARLANFRHAYYARVRRIDRGQQASGLAIVSDHVEGTLSEILRVAHEKPCSSTSTPPSASSTARARRAMLHENARDAAHGLIAPERIIVTPHTRLVIVEHVRPRRSRAAVRPRAFVQEFPNRHAAERGRSVRGSTTARTSGVGLVALALVLGRPIGAKRVSARDSRVAQRSARAFAARATSSRSRPRFARGSLVRCR